MKKQIALLVMMASLVSQVAFGACKNGVCSRRTTKKTTISQAIQRKYGKRATSASNVRSCKSGACSRQSRACNVRVARVAFAARKATGCTSGACKRQNRLAPARKTTGCKSGVCSRTTKPATHSRCSGGVCRRK